MPNPNARPHRELVVPDDVSGERLDRWLASLDEPDLTRSQWKKVLDAGDVTCKGEPVPARYSVKSGDVLMVTLPVTEPIDIIPEDVPHRVVYSDDDLIVVDKPAGVVTHPAIGNRTGTLVHGLLHRFGALAESGDPTRPGLVHRLDKETTGLLVVARSARALRPLQRAMAAREITRIYRALVWGHISDDEGEIDLPIGRSRRDPTRMAVRSDGRPSVTRYVLHERFRFCDLLNVSLLTGRTHQIRVHCAHLNHAVVGDPDYGGRESQLRGVFGPDRPLARDILKLLTRQALHAAELRFHHPFSGEALAFESPLPSDFAAVLAQLMASGR